MLSIYFILLYLVTNSGALSIGTVRAQNVTKREANVGDLFPDWVPFKNKHGEELGEFVQVAKPKPKKRLAPPINFILRAVAEPEGDDYYDKGQGESDGEDYYEKKDWSDLYRPASDSKPVGNISHTEVSDIDGVVDIITRRPTNPVVEALKKSKLASEHSKEDEEEEKKQNEKIVKDEMVSKEERKTKSLQPTQDKNQKYEDEVDYEESNSEKRKSDVVEDDQTENEAKKASILDSVDELKERHAEEQRTINEKIKEEEIYREERERDKIAARLSNGEPDKYEPRRTSYSKKATQLDYEEYDESPLDEKYVITPERTKPQTTTKAPLRTIKHKPKKEKQVETGKLSVFKNPQLYMIYDYDTEATTLAPTTTTTSTATTKSTTTTTPPKSKPKKNKAKGKEKYSAKYTSTPVNSEDSERISLVPEESDGKEGEPTLFFPKKRKNKKRKSKPTLPAVDSAVAETVPTKKAKKTTTTTTTEAETTAMATADTTAADTIVSDTTAETAPSAVEVETTGSDQISANADAVAAPSEHKAEPKNEDYHNEKGKWLFYIIFIHIPKG